MKRLILVAAIAVLLVGAALFFKFSGSEALWELSRGGSWLLPLIVVSALIDSINPCAFSILLLTVGFLVSLGKVRSDILRIGGFYILGLFAVYVLIGLGILQALHIFNTPHFMAKVGASLLIALGGLALINYFFPAFPIKPRIPQAAHKKMAVLMEQASLPAAFLLGALVGLCEFPCTGGPYLMILGLLHDQGQYLTGLGYLVFYNLIFILPLVVILLLASNEKILTAVNDWKRKETRLMKIGTGIAMIVLGLIMFSL